MPTQYRQLKPRPGQSGSGVAEHQRGRIYTATIELIDQTGYDALTVAAIVDTAGVSKHTFYENFSGKEECFLATYEVIVRHTARQVLAARNRVRGPRAKIQAGILAFTREVAERPQAARLALIGVLDVGGAATKSRSHTSGLFETLVTDSLAEIGDGVALPRPLRRAIVAGISQVARGRLLAGKEDGLPGTADELVDWLLALRSDAAMKVCGKRAYGGPAAQAGNRSHPNSLLEGCDRWRGNERAMILTAAAQIAAKDGYKTLTVTRIRSAAGVSRRSFEEHFDGVTDCFLAALEQLAASALAEARVAFLSADNWAVGVHRALVRLCRLLARNPSLVRLGFFELLVPGVDTVHWRARLVSNLGSLLRCVATVEQGPTGPGAEASVGAALDLLHHYAAAGGPRQLPSISGTLSYLVLAPAIGADATASLIREEHRRLHGSATRNGLDKLLESA